MADSKKLIKVVVMLLLFAATAVGVYFIFFAPSNEEGLPIYIFEIVRHGARAPFIESQKF